MRRTVLTSNCGGSQKKRRMKSRKAWATTGCALVVAVVTSFGWRATADEVQHLSVTVPGGMPGRPMVTGIQSQTNKVIVTWDGPSGYYQLFEKPIQGGAWHALGGRTNLSRKAVVAASYSNALFTVSGPAPNYVGETTCIECHATIHNTEQYTRHARAFQTLKNIHQENNPSCLPCHTVGYGLPTGYVNQTRTPQLEGVQCENCHGPGGNHAANPDDPTVRPRVELASTMCGGCHSWSVKPTYTEWAQSEHRLVSEPDMDANTCGRCHLAPARIAMLERRPVPQNDHSLAVECAVCHLPHSRAVYTNALSGRFAFTNALTGVGVIVNNTNLPRVYTNQVRNPLTSTKDYSLSTTDVFTNKYDPSINLCAQCHNRRGATWTNSSRAPHASLQYNMLLGTVGELPSGKAPNFPSTHSRLERQCVSCHMQTNNVADVTGHKFIVDSFEVCVQCHGDAATAEGLVAFARQAILSDVQTVKAALDYWALNKAPEPLRTKYGAGAWEYTNPGPLSPGVTAPTSSEQALLPVNIQKARFNLYLVYNDGSFGTHNGPFAVDLLNAAQTWVQEEINP